MGNKNTDRVPVRRHSDAGGAVVRHHEGSGRPPRQKKSGDPDRRSAGLIRILMVSVVILLLALVCIRIVIFYNDETALLIPEVTIEAGTVKPDISMFFSEEPVFTGLVSSNLDLDEVNADLPQTVRFNINMYGRNFPCRLIIQDTVPPVGEAVPQKLFACEEIPDVLTCLTGIEDVTDVSAEWISIPDISQGGNFQISALLTDACGNQTEVSVPFEVTRDINPPEITGALDIDAYLGDSVSYRQNVAVTDDHDESPVLEIDTSAVDLTEPGKYDVIYRARDFSGNESSVTVSLVISKKPAGYVEPEVVYEAAREILDEITEPGMTDEEIALQIVWWCRYNIRFVLRNDYNSWTEAAYSAYTYRSGNCYAIVYAVKALLDVAGFENMVIERWPYQTAMHFWNYVLINGEWYHCDATWREGYDSYFFMYTTEELLNFWEGGWNGFQFNKDLYPESASESVQYRIDYENHTIEAP